ncbi:hypothetical protein BGZ49_005006, partial [Haplosporangium sp. Z 27]
MPKSEITPDGHYNVTWSDDEDNNEVHPDGGRRFGIKDLLDESKTRPPFDGFVFEQDTSEDSLSEDEDDILGNVQKKAEKNTNSVDKEVNQFNEALGLGDLEDESKTGRVIDKENDIVADSVTRGSGPHATLTKQASVQLGSRTPSSKQLQQTPLKPNLVKNPSQQGKAPAVSVNSPGGVLRAKTNQQQLPSSADNTAAALSKKGSLTRTFSAALDSNNNNNNDGDNASNTLNTPANTESRRRSLTKRGSAKARLVVHKDEPTSKAVAGNTTKRTKDSKPSAVLVKSAPIESATTLLSIERAVESQDKMVVGPADTKTKRRALTNDDDTWDIEYCPPPVEEQPYDPGFELDCFALSTVPPNIAYH